MSSINTKSAIAVKLKPKAETAIKKGHPWVFADSIIKQSKAGIAGDRVVIFSKKDNSFVALGLYDPNSPIRIKVLTRTNKQKLDQSYFDLKVQKALDKRLTLFPKHTNAYRLVFGENDDLPGLICDVYAGVVVVKIYSMIWVDYLPLIKESLIKVISCTCIVLRLSRLVKMALNDDDLEEGQLLFGDLEQEQIVIQEYGVSFNVNVIKGHKTGFFLDHRYNRYQVQKMSEGRSVLDVFSYAGGFSTHALVGGAVSATSMDISSHALALAKSNAQLNKTITGQHQTICGDAFEELARLINSKTTYDIVIIDPPSFAKSAKETQFAKSKYQQLAELGAQLTKKKGMLILASCSARVSSDDFFLAVAQGITKANKSIRLLNKTFHDVDHPIGFPEGAYLKCGYYRIG